MKRQDVHSTTDRAESEQRLVQRAIAGEPEAFTRLYDAYVNRIYRFIFLRVTDSQTAEDLTSQVFMKAWQSLPRYRKRKLSFSGWLFQVARNTIIDHYRTSKDTEPLENITATYSDPGADVSEAIHQQLTGEWLWDQLGRLTEEQREVLILKFVEGMSTREVAKVMDKRQGAIRALQMRALSALAQMVQPYEEEFERRS